MKQWVVLLVVLAGCAGDIADPAPFVAARAARPIAPDGAFQGCDIVADVFEPHCVSCHNASNRSGGLDLDSKGLGQRLVDGEASAMCGGEVGRVVPGVPEDSLLYNKVMGTAGCGQQMPLLADPLDDDEIECVRRYVMMLEVDPTFPDDDDGEVRP